MIWIILGLLTVLSLIILALATWIEVNPKGKPIIEIKKPTPAPPTSKKSCGNCSSCKCNTTKSSGPR